MWSNLKEKRQPPPPPKGGTEEEIDEKNMMNLKLNLNCIINE